MKQPKVLIVASVVSFISTFNRDNVYYLKKKLNCDLYIACNFKYTTNTDNAIIDLFIEELESNDVHIIDIPFARSPFSKVNLTCYRTLKKIIDKNSFDLIHVHTPTAGILTRFAARQARRNGTVVMYTCHGFHFHRTAPLKNWIMFFPIEYLMSFYCDYLVTINKEDYNRARNFLTKNVRYIPGVGVDLSKFEKCIVNREEYRNQLGIPTKSILILSVGELIARKNHEVIIRALAKLNNPNIFYAICGKGELKSYLRQLSIELGVGDNVILLGTRRDIPELYKTADIGALPSLIEGLGLAGIESIAAGTPLIASNVHGIMDYVVNGINGYTCNPHNSDAFANVIKCLVDSDALREAIKSNCANSVKQFDKQCALKTMWQIYDEILIDN